MTAAPFASSADDAATRERAVLMAVALACVLVPLNSTMLAVGLPRVVDDLGVSLGAASWLVTSYLLAMASLQPVAGGLGDRSGGAPSSWRGWPWFAVASLGAALASGLGLLIAFRVQQAVAGALVLPNAMALLRAGVPRERLGSRLGPPRRRDRPRGRGRARPSAACCSRWAAGARRSWSTCRSSRSRRPRAPRPAARDAGARRRSRRIPFDRAGAVLLPAALAAAAWALTGAGCAGRGAVLVAAAAAVLGVVLVRLELRRAHPILQPRLFLRRAFGAASAGVALSNLAMYVTFLALPVLLDRRGGFGSAVAGLVLASLSAASLVVTPVGGRLVDRLGPRIPAVPGLGLQAAGLVPLALGPGALPAAGLVACLVTGGIGLGLATSALQAAALAAVEAPAAGAAAGRVLHQPLRREHRGGGAAGGPAGPGGERHGRLRAAVRGPRAGGGGVGGLWRAAAGPAAH